MVLLAVLLAPAVARADSPGGTELAAGNLLVASESLRDPNFARSVVLLLEYGEEGALGLIVNRPTDIETARAIPELSGSPRAPATLWLGGPVAPTTAMALARSRKQPKGSRPVLDGLWLGDGREVVLRMVKKAPAGGARIYLGYAGWGSGQLELEVAVGGWHVLPGRVEAVFADDPERSWERLLLTARARWAALRGGAPYSAGGTVSHTIEAWSMASPPRPRYSRKSASTAPSG